MFKQNEQQSEEQRVFEVTTYLASKGIPVEKWTGAEGTKTVKDLLKEIDEGETVMEMGENGEVIRNVFVVAGDIYVTDPDSGKRLRLVEEVQVFNVDGKEKRRKNRGAVAEKAKSTEDPVQATIRGIQEELGLTITANDTQPPELIVEEADTPTYPGLKGRYNINRVQVELPADQFVPNNKSLLISTGEVMYAYSEQQPKKTTYFRWVPVD